MLKYEETAATTDVVLYSTCSKISDYALLCL